MSAVGSGISGLLILLLLLSTAEGLFFPSVSPPHPERFLTLVRHPVDICRRNGTTGTLAARPVFFFVRCLRPTRTYPPFVVSHCEAWRPLSWSSTIRRRSSREHAWRLPEPPFLSYGITRESPARGQMAHPQPPSHARSSARHWKGKKKKKKKIMSVETFVKSLRHSSESNICHHPHRQCRGD